MALRFGPAITVRSPRCGGSGWMLPFDRHFLSTTPRMKSIGWPTPSNESCEFDRRLGKGVFLDSALANEHVVSLALLMDGEHLMPCSVTVRGTLFNGSPSQSATSSSSPLCIFARASFTLTKVIGSITGDVERLGHDGLLK